jgi:Gp5 N-terminal OB domain
MSSRFLGREGMVWFLGVVEDRDDPLKLGRVRVRVKDIYSSNKALVPTNELPWATVIMPAYSPSFNKVGISPTGLIVGSTVVGFFFDSNDSNHPFVLGTFFGIPDNNISKHEVPEVAREINNVQKDYDSYEPSSAYGTRYPFNRVTRTESGHIIEVDDTPGRERIHVFHKSGTYREINNEGRLVEKIVGDHFEIVLGDQTVHIKGNVKLVVDGNVNMEVGGDFSASVSGTYDVTSGGNMSFKAPRIDLN